MSFFLARPSGGAVQPFRASIGSGIAAAFKGRCNAPAMSTKSRENGMMFRKNIGVRLARFRQIDLNQPSQHHDALEFSNGAIVLVTDLAAGAKGYGTAIACEPNRGKA
jgi:hypothetical protein